MTKRVPIDKAGLGTGFSVRDAYARGISRSRLEANDLLRPFWGTRQLAANDSLANRCRALLSRLPEHAAISHSTAALLWGIPLPTRLQGEMTHVTVPVGVRAPQRRNVRGHQRPLASTDVSSPFGFRMTSPARTWCDLAEQLELAEVVAAGDFLIHWETPLLTTTALSDYLSTQRSRRGTARARDSVRRLSDRAESYRESILRVAVVDAGFPEPCVNYEIRDARGRFIARVDLAWPELMVALEYEGDHHRTDRVQWQRDLQRVETIHDLGWRIVRVSAADLAAPVVLFARLHRLLAH